MAITFIRVTDQRSPQGHKMWECSCDFCGAIVTYRSDWVKSGRVKSCGCMQNEGINLLGQKIGKWSIFKKATRDEWLARPGRKDRAATSENKRGARACFWWGRCECGTEKVLSGASLRNGDSRMCFSCARHTDASMAVMEKQKAQTKSKDDSYIASIIGNRHGHMVVTGRAPDRFSLPVAHVSMRCDCGKEVSRRLSEYRADPPTQCGRYCPTIFSYKPPDPETEPYIRTSNKIGARFGKLVVTGMSDKRELNGARYLICKCDCGVTCETSQGQLSPSGGKAACADCARKDYGFSKAKQRSGKVGYVKIIRQVDRRELPNLPYGPYIPTVLKAGALFLCVCDCGNIVVKRGSELGNVPPGSTLFCGMYCIKRKHHLHTTATTKNWGVITRLFKPGLALDTIIKQRPQKSDRRRPRL